MDGNLGRKEILDFISNLVEEMEFNIEDYLEKDSFMKYYNGGKEFNQASAYVRLDNSYIGKHYIEVIIPGNEDELIAKVKEINSAIEEFIRNLAENTSVVPKYEKDTFLYFRRVPSDFGIDLSIYERSKRKEERKPAYYVCDKCGKIFNHPQVRRENIGFVENPYYEDEVTSPCCRYSFEEVYKEEN